MFSPGRPFNSSFYIPYLVAQVSICLMYDLSRLMLSSIGCCPRYEFFLNKRHCFLLVDKFYILKLLPCSLPTYCYTYFCHIWKMAFCMLKSWNAFQDSLLTVTVTYRNTSSRIWYLFVFLCLKKGFVSLRSHTAADSIIFFLLQVGILSPVYQWYL